MGPEFLQGSCNEWNALWTVPWETMLDVPGMKGRKILLCCARTRLSQPFTNPKQDEFLGGRKSIALCIPN
jgi:hypothetical protein